MPIPLLRRGERYYSLEALSRDDEAKVIEAEVRREITSSDISNAVDATLKYGGKGFTAVVRGDGIAKSVYRIEDYAKEAKEIHGVAVKIRPRLLTAQAGGR